MAIISHEGVDYSGKSVKVQSDASATSLNALEVPNGQTVTSFLNSNFVVTTTQINSKVFVTSYGHVRMVTLSSLSLTNTEKVALGSTNVPPKTFNVWAFGSDSTPIRITVNTSGELYFANTAGTQIAGTNVVSGFCYLVE